MRRQALLLGVLALAACSDPREAELAQELVALQEARVARSSFERMRTEVEAAEAEIAALEPELGALRAERGEAQAAVGAVEASVQREIARNAALNAEIQAAQQRLQQDTARHAELDEEVSIARARAATFKDQAAVLARELRPDDPDWARRLRVKSLREFLNDVAAAWPGDPVLAEAARSALPADDAEAMRVGAQLAARIRDRVSEVYGLEAAQGASDPPALAAEGGAS
jgi:DNA repair exonuclease SbcCD ATPase subunit